MMTRILTGSVLALLLLVGGVALVWHMAYGVQDTSDPAEVVDIRSSDLYEDLGRAHATHRTWVSLLLRQAAIGRLGAWFGASATAEDIRAVELGFATTARIAFQALPTADQERLESYARGMNAGLAEVDASLAAPVVVLDAEPERWEAWHALAVERLVLWLQMNHVDGSTDKALQRRLAWFGGPLNHAWMADDGSAGARLLTGSSAVPLFLEVFVRGGAGEWVATALTVPGTAMAPVGRHRAAAWAFLFRPNVSMLPPSEGLSVEHDRVQSGLDEVLVARHRRPDDATRLPGPDADLQWAGLGAHTDAPRWMALLERGTADGWQLLAPDGLVWQPGELVRTTGNPETIVRAGPVTFITNATAELSATGAVAGSAVALEPGVLPTSTHSPYARDRVQAFVAAVPDSVALSPASTHALTYLRNWNETFDATEIGATLFDALRLPPDGPPQEPLSRLNRAMDRLTVKLGPDPSRWRWADAHPIRLTFPGWTEVGAERNAEPAHQQNLRTARIFRDRYSPITVYGGGHPTSLVWHPTPGAPAASAWEGVVRARGALAFRRPDIRFDAFLGRSMRLDHPIDPVTVRP